MITSDARFVLFLHPHRLVTTRHAQDHDFDDLPSATQTYPFLRVTNARTEGYNRKIKQTKRVACGFRNQTSYGRRILLNNAATAA